MHILMGRAKRGHAMDTRKGTMQKLLKRAAAVFLAVSGTAGLASAQSRPPSGFFDWNVNDTPYPSNFTPSPFLDNDNASEVRAALNRARGLGRPLAVKVREPLTSSESRRIFNDFAVQYVFMDFEDPDTASDQARAISALVLGSNRSRNAYVGNFNFYPGASSDTTRPGNVEQSAPSFDHRPEDFDYANLRTSRRSGRSTIRNRLMANESLYPGSPDFRNPAQGDSTAPNIRSALFTLPIQRASIAERRLPSGDLHIPWVTRFNNFGNSALDTDNNPDAGSFGHQYEFVQTGFAPGSENLGQLPSRGDFRAQILHYRMRGADSVNLFNYSESVVGYTDEEEREDVRAGWALSGVANDIFRRGRFAFANLTNFIGTTGFTSGDRAGFPGSTTIEQAGAVWSGVYDRSGRGRRLVLLLSNLSDDTVNIDLPNSYIGGMMTFGRNRQNQAQQFTDDYVMEAGQHRLLTFTESGRRWLLDSDIEVFGADGLDDRSGVGVPEPTGLTLLGLGAVGLLARRRRAVTA